MAQSLSDSKLRVAIVGAGPGGLYAAVELLRSKEIPCVVDVFDKLPTPYGLVRNGVAPDHQKIKSVTRGYENEISTREGQFRLFGNVEISRHISVDDLLARYHAVIIATGAQSDRRLGIPGEELHNVHPASMFVAWYNGHPELEKAKFNLAAERVIVIGHGNVAVDCARMLARSTEELGKTDLSDRALAEFAKSKVRDIVVVGRQGPAQASFTPPELKELTQLAEADLIAYEQDAIVDPITEAALANGSVETRVAKNLEIIRQATHNQCREGRKTVRLRFLLNPVAILGDTRVTGMRFCVNRQVIREDGTLTLEPTDRFEDIECEAVFRSIGYRLLPVQGVPFDPVQERIPHEVGRILHFAGGTPAKGLYVSGWAKRGPTGVIGTNKPDAIETVKSLVEDHREGRLSAPRLSGSEHDIERLLNDREVDYFSFSDWKLLDQIEVQAGTVQGRPRQKFTDVESMLGAIADSKLTATFDDELASA
jgi:ferredoxin--NADP+ reductase